MSNRRFVFIVNPVSGTGKQKNIERVIAAIAEKKAVDAHVAYTAYAGHASEIAKQAVLDGIDVVAIVGGDGSVNETAQSLIHSNTAMAIVPTGSGNGLARHFKISTNLAKAIEKAFSGTPQTMDVGTMGNHIFLSTAGFGFDAKVAHAFAKQKKRGFKTYIKTVRKELFQYKPFNFVLHQDNEQESHEAFMLSAANIPQFGNNFVINPLANEQDGLLNLTVIKPFPKYKIPAMINRFFSTSIHRSKYFTEFKGENFKLDLPHSYAHVDGEPIILDSLQCEIGVQKKCLNVIV